MDLDKAYVYALLTGGKEALVGANEAGFRPELLTGDGRKAYDVAYDHLQRFGELPSLEVIQAKTDLILDPVKEPAAFFAEELVNRSIHVGLSEALKETVQSMEANDPRKALSVILTRAQEIQRSTLSTVGLQSLPAMMREAHEWYERVKAGERGILTPWPSINNATMGFWPEDLVLFVARAGIGKCVAADTEITDPDTGLVRTIEEVVTDDEHRRVHSWSREHGIVTAPIAAKVDTGWKDCLRFRFLSGRSVVVTPEHPFLTAGGWRRADELHEGFTVATPGRIPLPDKPLSLTTETVQLLALMAAEGTTTGNHTGFSTSDSTILALAEGVAEAFDCDVKHRDNYDYDFVQRGTGRHPIRTCLREHGLIKALAKDKTVPPAVFRLAADGLAEFLRVFWMCDGYVAKDGSPGVTLASERFARSLQHLLLRLGVQSSVHPKTATVDGEKFPAWRLRVVSACIETFARSIRLWGEKGARLEEALTTSRNPNVGLPTATPEVVARLGRLLEEQPTARDRAALMLDRRDRPLLRDLVTRKARLSPTVLPAFMTAVGDDGLDWLWRDLFWDEVVSIQPVGRTKVYDLTVDDTHCFVANDVIVHNTWTAILIAREAWLQEKKVLFVTTEIAKATLALRFAAAHLKLPYGALRKGELGEFWEERWVNSIDEHKDDNRFMVVGGDFDFRVETLWAYVDAYEPDILVVDGIYLLRSEEKSEKKNERAASVYDDLKRGAKRFHIPICATTQFNRTVKKGSKEPDSDAIAQTDASGWNADCAYGLVQSKRMKTDKEMIFHPMKVREGTLDDVPTHWDFEEMNFDEMEGKSSSGPPEPGRPPPSDSGGGGDDGPQTEIPF